MKKLCLLGLFLLTSCGMHYKSDFNADLMGYSVSAVSQNDIVVKSK